MKKQEADTLAVKMTMVLLNSSPKEILSYNSGRYRPSNITTFIKELSESLEKDIEHAPENSTLDGL